MPRLNEWGGVKPWEDVGAANMNDLIKEFGNWLATTPLSAWEGGQNWLIPNSQAIHIVCVGMLFAAVGRLDLRLLGVFGLNQPVSQMVKRYVPWMWGMLLVLLTTGIVQTVAEPARELMNPSFRYKMLLLVIVLGTTLWLIQQLKTRAAEWDKLPVSGTSKLVGGVSIACWVVMIFLGRWIAYTQ